MSEAELEETKAAPLIIICKINVIIVCNFCLFLFRGLIFRNKFSGLHLFFDL
jgi:hypothetical protein